ncbi:MAG TPA: glycogen synthase [Jatrophihabitans sp.]|jgi:starch synthase|uniref:glycogen synthase n=1 Tax=Jatrophihabitans sp. TaxID=1932789 RepID=UPI002E06C304|nr:glycogen synthase [Jatrophihabitans sp.]
MRVAVLSREYPPEVYGGAGVHVEFLVRELRRLVDVDVHCFGQPRDEPGVFSYATPSGLAEANSALRTLGVDLEMAAAVGGADVLHSHTWYANVAGVLGSRLHDIPHVLSAHSLEPQRPWKAEQLGGGYRVSSWAERQGYETADAIVAVSYGMRADVLDAYPFVDPAKVHVIHNGIDTDLYAPVPGDDALARHGIDPDRPYAIFVGRITRQKGLAHLLRAAEQFDPEVQLVLCAGAPDTPEIAAEISGLVEHLASTRSGVVWIQDMLPRDQLGELLTHATVFVCPSVYEPLGIVNLEAMACETAVVASAVGGIPEVVADGLTGLLVPYHAVPTDEFESVLADAVNTLCADPVRATAMGLAGRERAIHEFGWDTIAHRTVELYEAVAR